MKRLFKEHKEAFIFTKQSLTNRLIHYINDYAKTKPVQELSIIIFAKFVTGQIAIKVNNEEQHNVLMDMLRQVNEDFNKVNDNYDVFYNYYVCSGNYDFSLLDRYKTLRDVYTNNLITKYIDFDNPEELIDSGEKMDKDNEDFER